jgi:hypothetical protein
LVRLEHYQITIGISNGWFGGLLYVPAQRRARPMSRIGADVRAFLASRTRAWWVIVCNMAAIVGLIFSAVGVVLLFWYALPVQPPLGPRPITDEGQPGGAEQWVLYNWLSHIGLICVILGTVLEAAPSICVIVLLTKAARPRRRSPRQ